MTEHTSAWQRRKLLKTSAGLVLAQALANRSVGAANEVRAAQGDGRPGDFDFLTGEWRIQHRRLKDSERQLWDEFRGEATCFGILNGCASIEELRIPERKFFGMGLRLLDQQQKVWADFWVNQQSGVLTPPGLTGRFAGGVGTFTAEDTDDGKPIQVRGVWDRITPRSCRWHQAVSRDGGRTWNENWFMDWTRV